MIHQIKKYEFLLYGLVNLIYLPQSFEVDRSSLPNHIVETHISLFDGSNEGIKHKNLPIFSVQYHPEASPGPHDSSYLFKDFYNMIDNYA